MNELSEAERLRRSEVAKRLHAEGKFGGPQPGSGRPRKPRASEVVAEKAREHGELIANTYLEVLQSTQVSAQVKLQASRDWLGVEHQEVDLERKEERDLESLRKDELIEQLMGFMENSGAIITLPPDAVEEVQALDAGDVAEI